ncbi:MAG: response regulator [Acidobacteria bacterium]|nr:response regulator [Acidobacteriota bacterium]
MSRGLRLPVLSLRWASTERPVPCLDHGVRNVTLPIKPSVLHRALVASLEPKAVRDSALTPFAHGGEANGLASLRVLVADDNAINQRMAVKLLERLGLDATVVGDGVRAIGALAEQPYDVVLMDLRMPVMDGLEATRQIRATRNARQPYVIAMTADALPEHREECLAVGMNDYLPKPVGIAALREALERAVSALSAVHARAGP